MTSVKVEYAGFSYLIDMREGDNILRAYPVPGQHPAAAKEKHRRAALQIYFEEF